MKPSAEKLAGRKRGSLFGPFSKRSEEPIEPEIDLSKSKSNAKPVPDIPQDQKGTLELMHDIVIKLRQDPEFASNVYKNCPRLQHLLEKRPDLRPLFEDPKFVRINFEDVYRKEGGKLPEDEDYDLAKIRKKGQPSFCTRMVTIVVNHPLFKVFKFLLFIKKVVGCVFGGGFSFVTGFLHGCFCDSAADAAADAAGNQDVDVDADGDGNSDNNDQGQQNQNPAFQANQDALNKAAEHLEDPEVQQQMQELLQKDPDELAQAIEDDDNLRALRDSNPVCAELMSDPDTMKIVVDPDNLRALGEAPSLIEADFADPDWSPPDGDIEMGGGTDPGDVGGMGDGMGDQSPAVQSVIPDDSNVQSNLLDNTMPDDNALDVDHLDADADADGDLADGNQGPDTDVNQSPDTDGNQGPDTDGNQGADTDVQNDADGDGIDDAEEDEEGNMLEDYELGDSDDKGGAANHRANAMRSQVKQRQPQTQQRGGAQSGGGGGGVGGFFSQIGAGITDMVAAELVGFGFSELTGDDGLDGALGGAADTADQAAAAEKVVDAAETADNVVNPDIVGNVEAGMDEFEGANEDAPGNNADKTSTAAGVAAGGAAGAAMVGNDTDKQKSRDGKEGEEEEEEKEGRFAFVGNFLSAVTGAAQEYVATTLLGDDLGALVVEKFAEEEEEEEDEDGDKDGDGDGKEGPAGEKDGAQTEPGKTEQSRSLPAFSEEPAQVTSEPTGRRGLLGLGLFRRQGKVSPSAGSMPSLASERIII